MDENTKHDRDAPIKNSAINNKVELFLEFKKMKRLNAHVTKEKLNGI